jgi:hypothetical protein
MVSAFKLIVVVEAAVCDSGFEAEFMPIDAC